MILRSTLDAEMKDATRAGVALQNKKAGERKKINLYLFVEFL